MFHFTLNDQDRQIVIQALDVLTRNVGAEINKIGGNAARQGAMHLIAIDNVGRQFAEAKPVEEKPADPAVPPNPDGDKAD
jgi:hypothetical protein